MPEYPAPQKTEAESVAAIVKAGLAPLVLPDRVGVVVMPNGQKINLDDERFADQPKRKRAAVALVETHSFIGYVNAHKRVGFSHLFGEASEEGGKFNAILDYHEEDICETSAAGWGEHNCSLTLSTTTEWRRWLTNNSKLMTQASFAEFLEDNLSDIIEPDTGILMDVVQLLTGKKQVAFKSGKNLKDGAVTFEYTELIEATGSRVNDTMRVPDHFVVSICPFVGTAAVEVKARLRFRIGENGAVSFAYLLDRPFKIIEAAFIAARLEIEAKTGLSVYLGTAKVIAPAVL